MPLEGAGQGVLPSPRWVGRGRGWARTRITLALGVAILAAAPSVTAQEIYQAVVLDLTELEIHVIVASTRGDEQVRCLLRNAAGRVRVAGVKPVAAGLASGGTTILTIPLPLLEPQESEFAVVLMRGEAELHRTEWLPLFRRSEGRTTP